MAEVNSILLTFKLDDGQMSDQEFQELDNHTIDVPLHVLHEYIKDNYDCDGKHPHITTISV